MTDSQEQNSSPYSPSDLVLSEIADECSADSHAWFDMSVGSNKYDPDALIDLFLLCLGGEVGEVQNVWKKYRRGSISRAKAVTMLEDELADVFIYLMNFPNLLGFSMEEAYSVKRQFNQERFGADSE